MSLSGLQITLAHHPAVAATPADDLTNVRISHAAVLGVVKTLLLVPHLDYECIDLYLR